MFKKKATLEDLREFVREMRSEFAYSSRMRDQLSTRIESVISSVDKLAKDFEKATTPEEPTVKDSGWTLEKDGRTVVFYESHPELDILSGEKGKLIARQKPTEELYEYIQSMMHRQITGTEPEDDGPVQQFLVEINGELLQVAATDVRVVEKKSRK